MFKLTVCAQLSQIMKVFYQKLAYTSILHYLDQINCKNQEVFQKGCNGNYKVKEGNNIDNSRLKPKRIKEHWGVTQVERIKFLPKTIKCSFFHMFLPFSILFFFFLFFLFFFCFLFFFWYQAFRISTPIPPHLNHCKQKNFSNKKINALPFPKVR